MPQTPHPLDIVVDELDDFGRDLVRIFTRDNEIDDDEHAALKRHGIIFNGTSSYRLREVAADSYKRNGASQLTVDRFKDAGAALVDLVAERKSRPGANVINFRSHKTAG